MTNSFKNTIYLIYYAIILLCIRVGGILVYNNYSHTEIDSNTIGVSVVGGWGRGEGSNF